MSHANKRWPDDYKEWKGNFDELIRTSAQVLRQVCPAVEPPTASLVRYYQNQGVVGKGTRQGRGAVFSVEELSQVVGAKQMVANQVPLAIAREIFNSPEYAASTYLPKTSDYASPAIATSVALQNADKGKNEAEKLVAHLMMQSSNTPAPQLGGTSHARRSLAAFLAPAGAHVPRVDTPVSAPLPPQTVSPLPPGGVLRYALDHGVCVEIPADDQDRRAQAQALRDFAERISPAPQRNAP